MRKIAFAMFVAALCLAFVAPMGVMAQEAQQKQDAAHKAVGGTMKTVGEAAKGTTETAVSPFVAFVKWLKGEKKAQNIVTDTTDKAGETVYDAGVNTGETLTGKNQ